MARSSRSFFLMTSLLFNSAFANDERPNFLIVLGDNLGKDWIGCYGSDNPTPHVDRLASEGVRFRHCYVTPLCSTTRVMLYTGRYGFRTGWHTHHDAGIYGGGGFDPQREITWARLLREAGYATAITGKWQINDLYDERDVVRRHGFDEHLLWTGALVGTGMAEQRWQASLQPGGSRELEGRFQDPVVFHNGVHQTLTGKFGPDVYVDELIAFMKRHAEKKQPFLAYYATPLTHVPPVPTPISPDPKAPPREQFVGMVKYFDLQIGRLRDALKAMGVSDNTIIVVMTDNGTPAYLSGSVGGKKATGALGTLLENGLDVPLVVHCPAKVAQGRVSSALVDATDLFPTLAELAGVPLPADVTIDGRSFVGQLDTRREAPARREWIFSQYADTRVVRDQRHKLYSTGPFFDLEQDPDEKADLSKGTDEPTRAARQKLQAVLNQLPPQNVNLPFPPRSSSAFKLREQKAPTPVKKKAS